MWGLIFFFNICLGKVNPKWGGENSINIQFLEKEPEADN